MGNSAKEKSISAVKVQVDRATEPEGTVGSNKRRSADVKASKAPKKSAKDATDSGKNQMSGLKDFRTGSLADNIVQILSNHKGREGLSASDIVEKGRKMNLEYFLRDPVAVKKQVLKRLSRHPENFARVKTGYYSLVTDPSSAGKASASSAQASESLGMARNQLERRLRTTKMQLSKIQSKRSETLEDIAKLKVALEEAKQIVSENTMSVEQASQVSPSELTQFDLSEEDRAFKGDSDDRKAILEHRQKVQQMVRQLEKAKETYIKEHQERNLEKRRSELSNLRELESALLDAEYKLQQMDENARELLESIASIDVELANLPPSQRRQRRTSGQENEVDEKIKYPVEDSKVKEAKKLFAPTWLDVESAGRLLKMLAISDTLLLLGTRTLGVKAPNVHELEVIIEKSISKASSGIQSDLLPDLLHQLYEAVVEILVLDDVQRSNPMPGSKRWSHIFSDGSWPEIMRRFVLIKDSDRSSECDKPDSHAVLAASMLGYDAIETLTFDQHVALLHYLTNNALLDSSIYRDVLQKRETSAYNAIKGAKDELSEERKRLKEIQEEAKRLDQTPCQEICSQTDEVEISIVLPENLQEFKGVVGSKEHEEFLRQQAAVRRKLEKSRTRVLADRLRAERAQAAQQKKISDEKEKIANQIVAAEASMKIAKQTMEEKLEKFKVRREPLGSDRNNCRYWWGAGGSKSEILVEDPDGKLGVISTVKDFEKLVASLETRGIQEHKLHEALIRYGDEIMNGIKRFVKEIPPESREVQQSKDSGAIRHSSRESKQVEFFDPSKARRSQTAPTATRRAPKRSPLTFRDQLSIIQLPSSINISFADSIFELMEIRKDYLDAGIPGPSQDKRLDLWSQKVTTFGHEYAGNDYRQQTVVSIMAILKEATMEIELLLYKKSKALQGIAPNDEQESDEESMSNSETESAHRRSSVSVISPSKFQDIEATSFSPKKNPRLSIYLWQTMKERDSWLVDVESSRTPARLSYCVRILRLQSKPLIRRAGLPLNS